MSGSLATLHLGSGMLGGGMVSVQHSSIICVRVCVCKSCAAKIPSGQTGPPIDCLLSFFSIKRDVLGLAGSLLEWGRRSLTATFLSFLHPHFNLSPDQPLKLREEKCLPMCEWVWVWMSGEMGECVSG